MSGCGRTCAERKAVKQGSRDTSWKGAHHAFGMPALERFCRDTARASDESADTESTSGGLRIEYNFPSWYSTRFHQCAELCCRRRPVSVGGSGGGGGGGESKSRGSASPAARVP